MRRHPQQSLLTRPSIHCRWLLLHQERLNPVVVALLVDPIGDRHRFFWHLEPLAEGPGEALQLGAGERPQAAVEVLDGLGIEGCLAGVGRGRGM
jgi:hypothetical protein